MFSPLLFPLSLLALGAAAAPMASPAETASAPGPTLTTNFSWICSQDEDAWLQSASPMEPSAAVLGDSSTAGQFQIQSGNLVQLATTTPSFLFASVDAASGAVSFDATAGLGTFSFSGSDDSLTFHMDGITNQGWFICNGQVFVQLNSTIPEGCTPISLGGLSTPSIM